MVSSAHPIHRLRKRVSRPAIKWATMLTFISAILTYVANSVERVRVTKLDYVNAQIERLYGPLYALTQAEDKAWRQFLISNRLAGGSFVFGDHPPEPNSEQVDAWRLWMKTVFQPLNVKMEEAIVANSQLVIGDKLSPVFLQLITQTEAYKAITTGWKESDRNDVKKYTSRESNTVENLNYPVGIISCVQAAYTELKKRQQRLESGLAIFEIFAPPITSDRSCSPD